MLMEWCDAGSLMMALEDGRLPPVGSAGDRSGFEAICLTLLEVALAMHHLHCMHIIHCDLKAKNVLLSSSQVGSCETHSAQLSVRCSGAISLVSVAPGPFSQAIACM